LVWVGVVRCEREWVTFLSSGCAWGILDVCVEELVAGFDFMCAG
jgi:hypothetical protein